MLDKTQKIICGTLLLALLSMSWVYRTDSTARLAADLPAAPPNASTADRPNVIFILSDDHRYDFMGFTGKVPGLKTPNMDRMATQGIHCPNAFVNTALCSPSRASILTGQYSHVHEVVDNQADAKESLRFFPEYLQEAGYETAFFGKWHMGHGDDSPRPGFDRWVSFKGQGVYYNPNLNVDGERVTHGDSAYITDVLTDYALDFMKKDRPDDQPYFVYLSHKAVHAGFKPARRHRGVYADTEIQYPATMYPPNVDLQNYNSVTAPKPDLENLRKAIEVGYRYEAVPNWVKAQRNSWHGVDYMYNGGTDFNSFYRDYLETVLGIDESIGAVLQQLEDSGQLENTIVFYMGDNGFSFGEHGLIDKRHAYEESMKVPLLVYGPGLLNGTSVNSSEASRKLDQMVTNVDIGPTILDIAGAEIPADMNGRSFHPLLRGEEIEDWRKNFFYEYYWERPFPQTPTVHAIRSDSFKFIRYHGIWDLNEFYDLVNDPQEARNLIDDPAHAERIRSMNRELFTWLEETQGLKIPLKPTLGIRGGQDWRYGHTY